VWWAFMFWHPQHLRNLPALAEWAGPERERLVVTAFFVVVAVSIAGCFFAGALARRIGYRRAIALCFLGLFASMAGAFAGERDYRTLVYAFFPAIGFFSGAFGLFTMYLPPLFPTLLRTTGAGFGYNIGRVAAAFGTVLFGLFSHVGDFRMALLYASLLLPVAMLVTWLMPDLAVEPA
jgi:MFS family permease